MFAIFRGSPSADLARIGEEHMEKDLSASDRERLRKAASKVSTHSIIGSLLGMGLGIFMARKIHMNRLALYNAFKMTSRPTELVFANGHRETIPDLEPYLRPTGLSDALTYSAFGLGGLFLGGEAGFLTGTASATSSITKDPESRRRIEEAFRRFQVDVLKREIDLLEGPEKNTESSWDRLKDKAAGMAHSLRS